MRVLHEAGFRVPRPIAWNRHTVVMGLVPGVLLKDVGVETFGGENGPVLDGVEETDLQNNEKAHAETENPEEKNRDTKEAKIAQLYSECIELALSLASRGCIHGDLNEFNILIENVPDAAADDIPTSNPPNRDTNTATSAPQPETTEPAPLIPHLIDFPQITSLSHPNAASLFARDIAGIKNHFRKRYNFEGEEEEPSLEDALERLRKAEEGGGEDDGGPKQRLDIQIEAAGFIRKPRGGGERTCSRRERQVDDANSASAGGKGALEEYYHGERNDEIEGIENVNRNREDRKLGEANVESVMESPRARGVESKVDATDSPDTAIAFLTISTNPHATTSTQQHTQGPHPLPGRAHMTKSKKAAAGWSI